MLKHKKNVVVPMCILASLYMTVIFEIFTRTSFCNDISPLNKVLPLLVQKVKNEHQGIEIQGNCEKKALVVYLLCNANCMASSLMCYLCTCSSFILKKTL